MLMKKEEIIPQFSVFKRRRPPFYSEDIYVDTYFTWGQAYYFVKEHNDAWENWEYWVKGEPLGTRHW